MSALDTAKEIGRIAVTVIGQGLKYAKLIAAEGGDGQFPTKTWQAVQGDHW